MVANNSYRLIVNPLLDKIEPKEIFIQTQTIMSKFLLNPVRSFEKIKDNYILYTKTAFGTRFKEDIADFESFESERERLLRSRPGS